MSLDKPGSKHVKEVSMFYLFVLKMVKEKVLVVKKLLLL